MPKKSGMWYEAALSSSLCTMPCKTMDGEQNLEQWDPHIECVSVVSALIYLYTFAYDKN